MRIILSIGLIFHVLHAQPDSRFDIFDWALYRQTESINSISEGYNYAYFATENAGILRFQLFQKRFDEPITTAQGLSSNKIKAIHFDQNTGMLWAASENSIEYSYNAKGDWFKAEISETGILSKSQVEQIGSSNNFIWISTENSFFKLDKISGLMMGMLPLPDEDDIIWSSKRDQYLEIPNILKDYTVMDGWSINQNGFINSIGKYVEPNTFYFGKNSEVYIGMEDGTIFNGDVQMETFYPYHYGLNNSDVTAFTKLDNLWIVGQNNFRTEGVTKYSLRNNEFQHIDFENSINLKRQPFYSILETDREVWFGGNSVVSIYNKKEDYWREITEANGIINGRVTSLAEDSTAIWVGTTRGLSKISKFSKHSEQIDLERLLTMRKINDIEIVGNKLWIATDNYLLIFDQENNLLVDLKNLGNTDSIKVREDVLNNFTDIFYSGDGVFISTPVGILKFDIHKEKWMVIAEPSVYEGSKVNNLVISDRYCFLGTDYGIWQINIKDGFSQLYDFPFIGSVQDMYIQGDKLLIGSDKGLIKYLWKKNL